jgi:hypothetical protein
MRATAEDERDAMVGAFLASLTAETPHVRHAEAFLLRELLYSVAGQG